MLQKFSKLTILTLVMMAITSISFGGLMEIGDVVMDYGFETDQPIDSLDWVSTAAWGINDYAPDTVFWQGDTLIKNVDFDASDIDSVAIVSDEYHTGAKSLFLTNVTDTIMTYSVAGFDLPDTLEMGAEFKVTFWTKYEIEEGEADYRQGFYDGDIEQTWTGLSDGWEKVEIESQWMGGLMISFGFKGRGKVWIDDVKLEQTGEQPTDLANNGFEEADPTNDFAPNNWYTAMSIIGYANDGEDSLNYAYVDGEGVNGSKAVKFVHNIDDTSEVGWLGWCQDFPMFPDNIYEVSCDVKISHMYQQELQFAQGWYYVEAPLINEEDERLDETGSTDGWITLKDTVFYPSQPSNYLQNIFRLELNGSPVLHPDSLLEVWVDNVRFKNLGKAPGMINNEYKVTKNDDGTYNIYIDGETGISYNLTKEPLEWTAEENLLSNPSFEEADSTGALASWTKYDEATSEPENFDVAYMEWLPADQGFGIDGSGAVYIGPEDPDNQDKGICATWGQYTPSNGQLMDKSDIYLYRVMANYTDVELAADRSSKVLPSDNQTIFDRDPSPEDSLNIDGVYIFPRYYHDTFHINAEFFPTNYGYDKKYGTSDGWEEQAYPLVPAGCFWSHWGHYFQVGIGSDYPGKLPCYGEVFFDDAAIVPFQEFQSGLGSTIENLEVPEGTKWLGVYGENAAGFKGTATVIYLDTAEVTVAVDEEKFARQFKLEQNYPNPFNPTTQITYYLPKHEVVNLHIYDILGREVTKLVKNKPMTAGEHQVKFDASTLASGVYFYKIQAGEHTAIKKMMLLK